MQQLSHQYGHATLATTAAYWPYRKVAHASWVGWDSLWQQLLAQLAVLQGCTPHTQLAAPHPHVPSRSQTRQPCQRHLNASSCSPPSQLNKNAVVKSLSCRSHALQQRVPGQAQAHHAHAGSLHINAHSHPQPCEASTGHVQSRDADYTHTEAQARSCTATQAAHCQRAIQAKHWQPAPAAEAAS